MLSFAFLLWGKSAGSHSNSMFSPSSAMPIPTPIVLQKEYVYAGSSLVAVVDPGASPGQVTDLAVWRLSGTSATWYVVNGETGTQSTHQWGSTGDIPAAGDYDGDSKTDFAVFRPSTGIWYIQRSTDGVVLSQSWGVNGDQPVPVDYDGDGRSDIAIFRPSNLTWYIINSASNTNTSQPTFCLLFFSA
jgi:hypothetical protein